MAVKEKILGKLRFFFLSGVLAIVPIIITYIVLRFLFEGLDNLLSPWITKFLGYHVPGLGVLATIVLIFLAGFLTANVVGSRIFKWAEAFVIKTPLVKTIYVSAKQLVEALTIADKKAFKQVVLVEYPRKGVYALGFLTEQIVIEFKDKGEDEMIAVFIPSTPTPVTGLVILFPKKDVVFLDITIEEGIKFFVSGGIASPKRFPLKENL